MNPPLSPTIVSEMISFGLWMRREGYRESTIRPCIRALRAIAKRTNLLNPESVKSYLASAELSENRKEKRKNEKRIKEGSISIAGTVSLGGGISELGVRTPYVGCPRP
jgi:hypothetical protein